MNIFISGGCKNGKSTLAQRIACKQQRPGAALWYLATMEPADAEDRERIDRHRQERADMGFSTLEQPRRIGEISARCAPGDALLLDSLTALLANEMFSAAGVDHTAPERIAQELCDLLTRYDNLVIVSDYLYSDARAYGGDTEGYRRGLALLDRACARRCAGVIELCAGQTILHKGVSLLETLL